MIVVPTLAKRNQRDKNIIAAIVVRRKTATPEDMRQRIDSERAVIEEHRADEESPDQHLPPGCA